MCMFFHGNVNKEEKLKRVIFLFYTLIKNIKNGAVYHGVLYI
jgi:hypothetical protein